MDEHLENEIHDLEEEVRRYVYNLLVTSTTSPARQELHNAIKSAVAESVSAELHQLRRDVQDLKGQISRLERQRQLTGIEELRDSVEDLKQRTEQNFENLIRQLNRVSSETPTTGDWYKDEVRRRTPPISVSTPRFRGLTKHRLTFSLMAVAVALVLVLGGAFLYRVYRAEPSAPYRATVDTRGSQSPDDSDRINGNSDNARTTEVGDGTGYPPERDGSEPEPATRDSAAQEAVSVADVARGWSALSQAQITMGNQPLKFADAMGKVCREKKIAACAYKKPPTSDKTLAGASAQFAAVLIAAKVDCQISISKIDGEIGPGTVASFRRLEGCLGKLDTRADPPCQLAGLCRAPLTMQSYTDQEYAARIIEVLDWMLPIVAVAHR